MIELRVGQMNKLKLIRCTSVLMLFLMMSLAGNASDTNSNPQDKSWWQKRHDRADIFYPHNAHMDVMKQEGDPCLLCHSFNRNKVVNAELVKSITTISNEPLEAVCHDCHVDKQKAPYECELCHNDPTVIWPENHNFDYIDQHAEDSRLDNGECQTCHLKLSFCTDCHFRRDRSKQRQHQLGYINTHGIDSRMNAYSCSRCHNAGYCADCHRGGSR